jgi:predicted RNase H-like nuclease (RuvC/YqgF family)
MERDLKDYLDKNFARLATKEEVKEEVSGLRTEMKDMEDRVLHQYHLTAEALRDDIKQVAEGVMNLNEKFDREISQFRKEVGHSHDELKAMIKFSYSELDRRITALEIELENLKHRIEKIERGSSIT